MKTVIVMLGKLGDIVSALPIARNLHLQGQTPDWIHSTDYSMVFQGVSYVKNVSVRLPHTKIGAVIARAEKEYDKVLVAQAFGPSWKGGYEHPHNVRAWLNCGLTVENFNDRENFPLLFDKRSVDRENFLYRHYVKSNKPLLLLALGAKSSIFNGRNALEAAIRKLWSAQFEIVALANVKAGRFYDLLGLMERARMLVTVDTSAMHLAAACNIKTVALIGDNVNTAAAPRCNVVLRVGYSEWLKRLQEIHGIISTVAVKNC